jgi:hypothetical protein
VTVSASALTEDRPQSWLDRWLSRRSTALIGVFLGLMIAGCSDNGTSDSGDDQGGGDSTFVPVDGAIQIAVTEEQKEEIQATCEEGSGVPGLGCQDLIPLLPEPCTPVNPWCMEIDFGPDPGSSDATLTIYPAESDPDDCSGPPCFSTAVSAEVVAELEERVFSDEPTSEPTTPEVPTETTTGPTTEESPSGLSSSPAESSS